jgi:FlaA1/EpsC-like NDP-sugar epimerase
MKPLSASRKSLPRRLLLLGIFDLLAVTASLLLSSEVRAGATGFADAFGGILVAASVTFAMLFSIGLRLGLYRMSRQYVGIADLSVIIRSVTVSYVVSGGVLYGFLGRWLSESVHPLAFGTAFLLSVLFVSGIRAAKRLWREWRFEIRPGASGRRRILLVGTASIADSIVREMKNEVAATRQPVGIVAVAPYTDGSTIHGVPVSRLEDIAHVLREHRPDEIVVAMPQPPTELVRRLVDLSSSERVGSVSILSRDSGARGMLATRPAELQDLLARPPLHLDEEAIRDVIAGCCVLITGAAGSIGSELARQVLPFDPRLLLLYDTNETGLFDLTRSLASASVTPIVGTVLDYAKMERVMTTFRPGVVLHAAAYKHVPLMEDFPEEAVRVNVLGTWETARAAWRCEVERFVYVSSDKAVNPRNVMGATKRVGELLMLHFAAERGTRFCSVRFGNVLGTRGSVVPIFLDQIRAGGPVTITHPEMERYFMSIQEATQLVIMSCTFDGGGEIYVLDMGEQIKISDIAEGLIRLCGFIPGKQIEIVYTGIRPGEKLNENLYASGEKRRTTRCPAIYAVTPPSDPNRVVLERGIESLRNFCDKGDANAIRDILQSLTSSHMPQT